MADFASILYCIVTVFFGFYMVSKDLKFLSVAFGQGEQFSWDELVADDEGDDEEQLDH